MKRLYKIAITGLVLASFNGFAQVLPPLIVPRAECNSDNSPGFNDSYAAPQVENLAGPGRCGNSNAAAIKVRNLNPDNQNSNNADLTKRPDYFTENDSVEITFDASKDMSDGGNASKKVFCDMPEFMVDAPSDAVDPNYRNKANALYIFSGVVSDVSDLPKADGVTAATVGLGNGFVNSSNLQSPNPNTHVDLDGKITLGPIPKDTPLQVGINLGAGLGQNEFSGTDAITIHRFVRDPINKNIYRLKIYFPDFLTRSTYGYTNKWGPESGKKYGDCIGGNPCTGMPQNRFCFYKFSFFVRDIRKSAAAGNYRSVFHPNNRTITVQGRRANNAGTPGAFSEFVVEFRYKGKSREATIASQLPNYGNVGDLGKISWPAQCEIVDDLPANGLCGLRPVNPRELPRSLNSVDAVPTDFEIVSFSPNPINSESTLLVDLYSATNVDISVYDMMGRKVKTLLSGNKIYGRYNIIWNGKDDANVMLQNGTYIIKAISGTGVKSTKAVILN